MQYKRNNTDLNDDMLECSLLLISILLKQYKENVIDVDCFKKHSEIKIKYILNNYQKITDTEQKELVKNLIKECIQINNTVKN